MKKLIVAISLAAAATAAWAACATHTYTLNGKTVTCTTCCYGAQCFTNCY